MHIIVEIEVSEEFVDPDHETGLTNEGYEELIDAIGSVGSVGDIRRA